MQTMAKRNNRQAKTGSRSRCEYPGCTSTFGRIWDRRRHVKEQHGPIIYCSYVGCEFQTRRLGKLRTHLKTVHHNQVSINLTTGAMPSECHTPTAQTLASPNHFSPLDVDADFFDPTPPPIPISYASTPQVPPAAFKSHAALYHHYHSSGSSTPPHNHASGLLATARTRPQSARPRVFKPPRAARRRKIRTAAAPSQTQLGEATLGFYANGRDAPNAFTQWMPPHTFNAESFAGVLDSLSLLDSSIGVAGSISNQPSNNLLWRNDTEDWDMMGEQ
ncbi:hypothetical protein N431DRAFT_17363 [Stipitochalara longipes BDJ]|nr:hypothetical protein N431DRAFT_17363 [Stipitochalara longipes BDJ]